MVRREWPRWYRRSVKPTPHTAAVSTRTRSARLDVLRLLAMAGVVAIHVLANSLHLGHPPGATGTAVLAADRVLNDISVQAFLFLTGMLVWARPVASTARAWWAPRTEVVFI